MATSTSSTAAAKRPRSARSGDRHIRVCTGTACFAACGDGHVEELKRGLAIELGEHAAEGSVSLAETVCLGFCHSAPAVRDGEVVDAGSGVVRRVLDGATRPALEPAWETTLQEPVLIRPGDWSGLGRALRMAKPEGLLEEVKAANVRGRGGAGFPAGLKWELARAAPGEQKFIVAAGDGGDPGSYIDKYLMERNPALVLEGMALAGYAVGARKGFVICSSEFPRSKPALEAEIDRALEEGLLGERILGSGFSFEITVAEGVGPPKAGTETAVVHGVETLCNISYIAFHGARAYRALSPGATPGSKLVCFNDGFRRPGVYEVRFGTTLRELCEDLAGGLVGGRAIKAVQIGGSLGGILPASQLDTPFDFDDLAAVGCMVGHGGIVAFHDQVDMGAVARHLRRYPAHGAGVAAPIQSLLTHFPDELEAGGRREGQATLTLGPEGSLDRDP
jgi:NADH:ubiquinone oxidoreductase subunit F (NADH-binding)